MPQFLNPAGALLAAALVVPPLILLYFLKLRRAPQPVSSTLLWKRSIQDLQVNAPFQRIRRNLLLLMQLLVLAALLFALARPVGSGQPVAGERSVILLDRSAGMRATDGQGGGSRLDEARARASALVGTMGRGQEAMVIAFGDRAEVLSPMTGDARTLRDAIDAASPSDRHARLRDAYRQANAQVQLDVELIRSDRPLDVFLFSHGRVPDDDVAELSLRGTLHYERVGTVTAENLGIVALSARRNFERPQEVQVFARAANFGPERRRAAIRVSVADVTPGEAARPVFRTVTSAPLALDLPPSGNAAAGEAGAIEVADLTLNLPGPAVIRVKLTAEDGGPHRDALVADDRAYVVVPPPEPLRVMLVTNGNYFLELLLATQPLDDPQIVVPAEYERRLAAGEAGDFDVVIFDDYSPPAVPPAGTFVYTGGLPPDGSTGIRQLADDAGVPQFFDDGEILDWQREHPALQGLVLSRLWVAEGRRLVLPLGVETLIEGVRGPLLVLERVGMRTNLVFSFDLTQSNWPQQRTFPYFGYQLFQFLAAGSDVRPRESMRPGQTQDVAASLLDRAGVAADGAVTLRVVEGDGPSLTARRGRDGTLTLGPFDFVGLYATDPPVPGFEMLAVSLLDPVASNIRPNPTDPGNLTGRDVPPEGTAGRDGAEAAPEAGATRDVEWWWYLVAAAALLLCLEWAVYLRRTSV